MMAEEKTRWLPCVIENAGFKSERRFEVDLPGGGGKVIGTAYVGYLKHKDDRPLSDDEPPYGQQIAGYVQCRVSSRHKGTVAIEFPGTDVFHVPQEAIMSS